MRLLQVTYKILKGILYHNKTSHQRSNTLSSGADAVSLNLSSLRITTGLHAILCDVGLETQWVSTPHMLLLNFLRHLQARFVLTTQSIKIDRFLPNLLY